MHVLLIHQAFATPSESGGTRHYELARHAIQRGHRFTVVASRFGYLAGATQRSGRKSEADSMPGLNVERCFTPHTGHRGFVGQLLELLVFSLSSLRASFLARDVDLVMGTSPPIFQAASAWLVAAVRGKPFLLEIRDLWPEFIVDMGKLRNPLAIALARALERFLYARADHLLVNSPAYVDYLIGHGVERSRISLIPNGVEPAAFRDVSDDDKRAQRQSFGVDSEFLVMYAGVMGPANDLTTLLAAADHLRDDPHIRIVLVGDGKSRASLQAQAAALALPNVVFAGPRAKSEMGTVLAAADACVATLQNIPMFRMTYPNKVFDYMAAGKPIVLGIDGVIRQVVEDANAGLFVPPGDAARLADAIRVLAKDPSASARMGEQGREFVLRRFDRALHGAEFADLIASVGKRRSDAVVARS